MFITLSEIPPPLTSKKKLGRGCAAADEMRLVHTQAFLSHLREYNPRNGVKMSRKLGYVWGIFFAEVSCVVSDALFSSFCTKLVFRREIIYSFLF